MTTATLRKVLATLYRAHHRWDKPAVSKVSDTTHDPFRILISCMLSLRTKDEVTDVASARLFALATTPRTLARLPAARIAKTIYPVGFYRTKATHVREVCRQLLTRYGGRVPSTIDELVTLPGVGRKTANLVITLAFRKAGICVDTHVHRISNRWGYVTTNTPEDTEMALRRVLPRRYWRIYNDVLVAFGQHLCHPTSPWCSRCPIERWCPKIGVRRRR